MHVIQRGNNRQACFFANAEYQEMAHANCGATKHPTTV